MEAERESVVFAVPTHRFFLDSDCLALKNNQDYQSLLKTLAVLEAQKLQAVKDLEQLVEARDQAERDPLGFVEALTHGSMKALPSRQKVEVIAEINWKGYTDSLQQVVQQKSAIFMNTRKQAGKLHHSSTTKAKAGLAGSLKGGEKSKPLSYRQPWSAEEQNRFEELLKIYPPEAVERRRFEKIATALGSRSTQQVASHVQKYFIKLANAGLPVPGRMPNMLKYMKSKRQRNKYSLNRPSTFFSSLSPRVYMTDGTVCAESSLYDDSSESDSMLSDSDSGKEVFDGRAPVVCSGCGSEVKVGIFWQCMECSEQTQQLCTACVNRDFHSGEHTSSHDMRVVSVAPSNTLDKDYTNFASQTHFNYLDPNFFPPS